MSAALKTILSPKTVCCKVRMSEVNLLPQRVIEIDLVWGNFIVQVIHREKKAKVMSNKTTEPNGLIPNENELFKIDNDNEPQVRYNLHLLVTTPFTNLKCGVDFMIAKVKSGK